MQAAKLAVKQKSDILITPQVGEIAFYALKDNLFDIYQTKDKTVKSVLDKFNKNKLKFVVVTNKQI